MTSTDVLKTLIEGRFDGNQAAFARAIGRSPSQVNQWLTGHRRLDVKGCRLIEKALGLATDYMLGEPSPTAKNHKTQPSRALVQRLSDIADTINDRGLMYLIGKAEEVAKVEPFDTRPHKTKAA